MADFTNKTIMDRFKSDWTSDLSNSILEEKYGTNIRTLRRIAERNGLPTKRYAQPVPMHYHRPRQWEHSPKARRKMAVAQSNRQRKAPHVTLSPPPWGS